ncbi:carbohydrate sulfotransferase 5-like isoform X2 [Mya arenaria]|nr:carbohydrate sulfotransferase 5-like isoform X2 [Mya arenaria]
MYTSEFAAQRFAAIIDGNRALNDIPANSNAGNVQVIVSAYMNSGSTFTGRVLGFRKDTFYFYEPLWHLTLWGFYRNNDTLCSTREQSCKKISLSKVNSNSPIPGRTVDFKVLHDTDITSNSKPLEVPLHILDHVINCRLLKVKNLIQPGVTDAIKFSGQSWNDYRYCLQRRGSLKHCLEQLEINNCETAQYVVTKVLRMSVGNYRPLLLHNPRLKVVHLFRDPRAIINSRIKTYGYPLDSSGRVKSVEVKRNAEALCSKMISDFEEGMKLQNDFPGRFKFIHYEDITSRDESLIQLHTYLGMRLTLKNLRGIRTDYTKAGASMNYKARDIRKKNNAFWWKDIIKWQTVTIVNAVCANLFDKLGYIRISTEQELRSFNETEVLQNLAFRLS